MKIGIVGAGLMGRLIALQLCQQHDSVTLFDKDDRAALSSCSIVAAGLLAPFAEIEGSAAILTTLGSYSIARWPAIIASCVQTAYFKKNGTITLAHSQDIGELQQFKQHYQHRGLAVESLQTCDQAQLAKLEPELVPQFHDAIYVPEEAHLSPPEILSALAATLLKQGVIWHSNTSVTQIKPHEIYYDNTVQHFDVVIDCRGLGAKTDLTLLRGVRGELVWLHAPDVHLTHPLRLLHPRYPVYIVPRPDSIYAVGASFIESEDFSPISVQTMLELLSAAYSVHKGFSEARIVNTLVNCRPALPDHIPKIFWCDGLIRVNGLYRYGYSVAPALMDDVVLLLNNGPQAVRFPELLGVLC